MTSSEVPFFDLEEHFSDTSDEVRAAFEAVFESQKFILGPQMEQFEEEFARLVGTRHAVGCASGTDALLLPLRALDPDRGDEVIIPAFTFFATAGAVWNAGFKPVFCDVDEETFNVTAATVRERWTERTRALVPVHLYGQMAPVEDLLEVAGDALLLEDAAQATGAEREIDREWRQAGSVGGAGSFSFFPTKNLGGLGDGGMITTDDDDLADRLRKLRVHGGRKMYHHEMVGTNSRLDTLQAAALLAKLPRLGDWLSARRANARIYDDALAEVDEIRTPVVAQGNRHTYNQYTIRARRRDELREHLSAEGIGSGVYYPAPLHLQECFSPLGYREGDLPVAERLSREVLSLPVFPELGRDRVERVADAVRAFYRGS